MMPHTQYAQIIVLNAKHTIRTNYCFGCRTHNTHKLLFWMPRTQYPQIIVLDVHTHNTHKLLFWMFTRFTNNYKHSAV